MMKASEVIAATKAAIADFDFTGVTTDSRAVKPGELFVALKGGNFDGHDYCVKAAELGAAGVVVSHDVEGLPAGVSVFKVEDTLLAYQQLAHAYRLKQQGLKVFAITGSNGKTSTKDLLAACLGAKYNVVKTQGNFNNEIGLPKTLLSIQPDTDIAVVEMGMRGLGQIAELCRIAEPDSGLITNVGETHMELLGSMENIGKAKSEIVVDLPSDGFAVLNGDNEYVLAAAGKTKAQVVYFGLGENCDYRGSDIVTSALGTTFTCTEKKSGKSVSVRLQLIGEHNVYNALSAIAGAACYGVPLEDSVKALATARLTGSRQEIIYIGDITFINDAYNASPASMEAALKTLAEAKKAAHGAVRTIAVLADMLELGAISEDAHRRVGRWAVENGVDYVLTYGPEAAYISEEVKKLGGEGCHYADRQGAADKLRQLATAGDIILLKGSNSMQVGKMLELFK
ncbi:UDP-N-acetylmuramoyl-tripeptide--D-alanyl-D-alanine ligase [uncultured Phascolarctobacterium sp.]|jgi:UDP-N-acetylmuramoyl-tripeptide--D-alanyl-D-alanine ligase|uniref:UDP-N-acetylmuramoyl-tripeptide--D-alanyl-D- alanine ligase n=2 Tax=Phascolarctobacterium TaxID=33024 RepID=UPI0025E7ED65|nr:UDP-N-acetylmuramoyl-tripeptide--D-alanyl-D-alanine ligase [uncultured Phascolarctobacterium sp.]